MRSLMLAALLFAAIAPARSTDLAPVRADQPMVFPRDYGSHPDFRTEWWYVTGWLNTAGGEPLGFQITFFRSKPGIEPDNPSAFAPKQLLIAHCAISDPKRGRLWQDQRIRRAGLGLAEAEEGDTDVRIDDWTLERHASAAADATNPGAAASAARSAYTAKIDAEDFSFDLTLSETQ